MGKNNKSMAVLIIVLKFLVQEDMDQKDKYILLQRENKIMFTESMIMFTESMQKLLRNNFKNLLKVIYNLE